MAVGEFKLFKGQPVQEAKPSESQVLIEIVAYLKKTLNLIDVEVLTVEEGVD
jgi:hypothetical protein